jgi:hypothetical protein
VPEGSGSLETFDDRRDTRPWLAVAALLVALSLVETLGGRVAGDPVAWNVALDWEPGRALHEPWRAWTAAGVHWSTGHLLGNLVATVIVAALGRAAGVGRLGALAWLVAWPFTHVLLGLVEAEAPARFASQVAHYGGLSGVLHAGVVIVGWSLLRSAGEAAAPPSPRRARERLVGTALLAGTLAKVLLEAPWDLALRPDALLGVRVAPLGHVAGVVAASLSFGACVAASRWRSSRRA